MKNKRENFIRSSEVRDMEVGELVKDYSIDDILNGLHKCVTRRKNINVMSQRERVLMEYAEVDYEYMEKWKLEEMIVRGKTMSEMVESIGCSYGILMVYMRNYGISMEELRENKESKGNEIRKKIIRKKYARY